MKFLAGILELLSKLFGRSPKPPPTEPTGETEHHHVLASSFADPADVAAFRRCKARGGSDQECFKKGDNGIGLWGDDTTGQIPMCALPPEDMIERWGAIDAARRKKVHVSANTRSVVCIVADRMPHRDHITNGAGIDLNPAAVYDLGLTPPVKVRAIWNWIS